MVTELLAYIRRFDRGLWILSFGWVVSALGFAVSIPFIAIYFHSTLGLSLSEIGIFFGTLAVIRSAFQALGGEVSDRMERRRLMILAQLFRAMTFLALFFFIAGEWGFWPIAASLVVSSIFGAIFQPAANAMVSDILPEEQRLDGYAITRSARNLGWAIGPALGGFLAAKSYALVFLISAVLTLLSVFILWLMLKSSKTEMARDQFRLRDIIAIKDDPNLAIHCGLVFIMFLVVAQLMAPFSVYVVEIAGISETGLGYLYGLNGLMVTVLQVPVTRMLAGRRFTSQLAAGALVYAVGYGILGAYTGLLYFALTIVIITIGEMIASPPSLTLTSKLAPPGRMGRYMGMYGFFVASGWSFGPLYGGMILDYFKGDPLVAWLVIASMAVISGIGYFFFSRRLPDRFNVETNG